MSAYGTRTPWPTSASSSTAVTVNFFVCPLVVRGSPCERRVGKLYLPPGGRYFGCRLCYDLTYESDQTHDKRVDALRKNPELLAAIVANPGAAPSPALGLHRSRQVCRFGRFAPPPPSCPASISGTRCGSSGS